MTSNGAPHKPNRLIDATSPYLLQHAYNPVDWREWGPEALGQAVTEDKPILVSIGYSACHWCHVMERECFEDPDLAALMNAHFICIKVDREERPDVDQVYMEAIQAMGMNGGWPLNVFLTPDQVPFYGGTYFPPQRWGTVLIELNKAFHERRSEIESSAAYLRNFLKEKPSGQNGESTLDPNLPQRMADGIASRFDPVHGGMDKAPKFIMPSIWQFLLRNAWRSGDQSGIDMVEKTLVAVACGGIYDQIGGGFARYSVDGRWFAPHFEKMLYDNGQLLSLYSEAFLVTGNPLFKTVVEETVEWLSREMTHPEGGFYSALDADSEGEEGKFYCWTSDELEAALGPDHALAMEYFGCTAGGNWEHGRNILLGRPSRERPAQLPAIREKLLLVRDQRIRPGLDDKIVTAWNAITIIGLTDASLAFGKKEWLERAIRAWEFSLRHLTIDGRLLRSYRGKPSVIDAFLDDAVFQIKAGLALYEATFEPRFLDEAIRLLEIVNEAFADGEGLYWYTSGQSAELFVRKKETWDNVIPSSNSVLASLLHRMGILMDRDDWVRRSANMVAGMTTSMEQGPAYAAQWGIALMEQLHGLDELVLAGTGAIPIRRELALNFLPVAIYCGTGHLPLAAGKPMVGGKDTIYLCHHRTCQAPVFTAGEVLKAIRDRTPDLAGGK